MRISDWSSDVCSSDLSDMSALQKSVCFNLWHEDIAMDLGSVDTALLSALNGKNDFHQIARSEAHTSELQSLMRNSHAVFCLINNEKYNKQNSQDRGTSRMPSTS